jgi:hypothetical protein
MHGHRFKISCMWLNMSFYLNSHRRYLSHLIYVSCLVFLLVSERGTTSVDLAGERFVLETPFNIKIITLDNIQKN